MKPITPTSPNSTTTIPQTSDTVESKPSLLLKLLDNVFNAAESGWLILIVTALAVAIRLLTVPDFAESREGILYVRGVVRYTVVELRPYWPGYPVYMWLGQLLNLWASDPVRALHLLAIFSSVLCIWPLAALAYDWQRSTGSSPKEASLAALGAAVMWALVPIAWLNGSEIFGDPTALLLSLTMLWLSWRSLRPSSNAATYLILAGILAGLVLGIRLAYVPLLLVLVYAVWQHRHYKVKKLPLPLAVLAALVVTVLIWFGWQLAMDGTKFFTVGIDQLNGHFSEWGDSALSDGSLWTRPVRLLKTYLTYGLGGWWPDTPIWRWLVTILFLTLTINGVRRLARFAESPLKIIVLIWTVSYFLATLAAFDVDLTRYYFPLVAINCIVAAMGLPTNWKFGYPLLLATAAALTLIVVPLAFEHQHHPPLGVQLTDYVTTEISQPTSEVLITDDTPTLFFFMQENAPNYQMLRLTNNILEKTSQQLVKNHTVYSTWLNGDAPKDWVPVARFCRNPLLESRGPLEMGLYRYDPNATSTVSITSLPCYNDTAH